MTTVLVDSSVLLDVATDDPAWGAWSSEHLRDAIDTADVVVNSIVFAEVSAGFETIEEADRLLPPDVFRREDVPWEAAFLAGKVFVEYRRRGGLRTSPLPDFFIGAHAAVRGYRLLTRDPTRFRRSYPKLDLVCP